MVTAWRKSDVTMVVTRARDGLGKEAEDCNPEVRRWSIVKLGFKRQKLTAVACGAAGWGWVVAALARSPSAA